MQEKHPHHRRQHALQVAGVFTALAVVVWLVTLGWRFGTVPQDTSGATITSADQTQLAGVGGSSDTSQTGLQVVATSTTYSNY